MTAPDPAPDAADIVPTPGAADPTPATQAAKVPYVTAVVVCRGASPSPDATLAAVAAQTRPVDRVILLDLSTGGMIRATAEPDSAVAPSAEPTVVTVHGGELESAFTAAVAAASHSTDPDAEWLWLLPDDALPEPQALRILVDAVLRSPSVGIAGPKILDRDRPRLLLEVGYQLTRTGRRIAAPAAGEPDQGQFDARTDVLAVGLPGLLVRRSLFERIGGFEPAFAGPGSALDLGWRAQLAGERVVVVPAARLLAGRGPAQPGSLGTAAERRAARATARRVALTRCSPWAVPFLAAWVVLTSIASALVLLLLKRPAHAWIELADLGALGHPFSSLGARWRFRSRRRLRRRDLSTLFVTAGESVRHTADRVQEALTPERSEDASAPATVAGALESGPTAEEAEDLNVLSASLPERIFTNPGVLATIAAAVCAGIGFRSSLRGGLLDAQGTGLAGGELVRVSTDAAGLWHAFRDSWHGAGLGSAGDSPPYLGVLATLTWLAERLPYLGDGRSPASVVLAWILVLGMPLATTAAYLAGRVVTRARWPRALVALAWGTSAVLAAGAAQGRVTLVLAHVLLPLVIAGVVSTARPDGTFTAAAATALGGAVLGALVPPYLVLLAVAALGLTVAGSGWGQRVRGLALLVLPPALQGSWLLRLADPLTWFAAPGALDGAADGGSTWWELLAGHPDGSTPWLVGLTAPALAAGWLSLLRHQPGRSRSVARSALAVLALLGLAWALLAPRVGVGSALGLDGAGVDATPWPGVGLQAYVLAMLALALLGTVGMRAALSGARFAPRRVSAAVALAVLTVAVLTSAGSLAWSRLDNTVRLGFEALPAVAVEQARGPEANRLLVITSGPAAVDYQIVAREPGEIMRAPLDAPAATDPGFAAAVATLAGRGSGDAASTGAVGTRLADLGIGFVSVQGTPDPALLRTLDATAGLTRLGSTDNQTLWRVLGRPSITASAEVVPPSRARITNAEGAPVAWVKVDGAHGALATTLGAGPVGRRLVLAESPEWADHAEVRFDGALVTATTGSQPTYLLPERAGRLTVDIPPHHPRWFAGQLGLLALTVFLAVPFGNRRSRRIR